METFNKNIDFICKQDFDGIVNRGDNFFCSGCNKNILDFRNKTYDEFLEITRNKEKYCGIYLRHQLTNKTKLDFSFRKRLIRFSALVIFLLTSVINFCREPSPQNNREDIQINKSTEIDSDLEKKNLTKFTIFETDKKKYYLSTQFPYFHMEDSRKFFIGF